MLLHLKKLASPSCLLGGQAPRLLSMRALRSSENVLTDSLRLIFGRRCLTTQLLTKNARRQSLLKGTGLGVTFFAVGGTTLARFLLQRGLHRVECKAGSVGRSSLQNESTNDSESEFNWRRLLALILPVKWLLSAAVAVSVYCSIQLL